ncbi:MAG TPA: HAD-IIIC family phosphatase [Caulobacteraceae bacterium]
MAWREPIVAGWRDELAALGKAVVSSEGLSAAAAGRLKRLASMRLGDGERLRLGRLARSATARPQLPPGFRRFRLLLASNRTTSFLAADLAAAGVARGLLIEAIETDYDAVRALALGPVRAPDEADVDAVLLLLDAGFFEAGAALLSDGGETEAAAAVGAELDAIVAGLRTKFRAPVIAATLATPPEAQIASADAAMAGSAVRATQTVNQAIVAAARSGAVAPFDLAALAARIGGAAFFDPVRFHQAKTPFSLEAGQVVADALAALIAAMVGKAARALVLDLDNTLWGGVVADDGLAGIVVGQGSAAGEAYLDVQRYALELRRRGVVLAACSKNLEEIAREPFRSHPDMLLREQHLSVLLASFDDKATNIARIAEMLDLDPSSLVLLDDNPAERERVRSALPWVMVPEVGDDPAYFVRAIASSGFFEHLALTQEDLGRADAYEARAQAKALQQTLGDYDAYLRSLQMVLTIAPFDDLGRARIAQLVQKSNQFNLTTKRYSEAQIAAFQGDPRYVAWQVRLKDRFADHGMISVLVADAGAADWSIDNWVMSCRVLERGVEATLVNELARLALKAGARSLIGTYRPTPRNGLVRELYERLGFAGEAAAEDGERRYRLDLSSAALAPTLIEVVLAGAPEPVAG